MMQNDEIVYSPPPSTIPTHFKSLEEYKTLYEQSIKNPEEFFGAMASKELSWFRPFTSVKSG